MPVNREEENVQLTFVVNFTEQNTKTHLHYRKQNRQARINNVNDGKARINRIMQTVLAYLPC